jgi:alkanesulfonate monooxygenase SsuD/methylene tetrahydromethanopterin reductase-like flavin-dependent oxidoreductase (luciferase family)
MTDSANRITVGVSVHETFLTPDAGERRRILDQVISSGLEQVTTGDHISFHGGAGFDGLLASTSILSTNERVRVLVGIYLLGLRHPMAVARQLATLSQLAPGRLVLGVGVGGEDRSEVFNAGVDPATRGRRLDEALGLVRQLATGEAVDHAGEFFTLENARILPPPNPPVPIIIGGAGDVAIRRTITHGDGWLGIFCTARRFAETVDRIRAESTERPAPGWFGLSTWTGFGADTSKARGLLDSKMEVLYRVPGEKFHHLTAAGPPEAVAENLAAYVEAGARNFTIVPVAETVQEGIEGAAKVQQLLNQHFDSSAAVSTSAVIGA